MAAMIQNNLSVTGAVGCDTRSALPRCGRVGFFRCSRSSPSAISSAPRARQRGVCGSHALHGGGAKPIGSAGRGRSCRAVRRNDPVSQVFRRLHAGHGCSSRIGDQMVDRRDAGIAGGEESDRPGSAHLGLPRRCTAGQIRAHDPADPLAHLRSPQGRVGALQDLRHPRRSGPLPAATSFDRPSRNDLSVQRQCDAGGRPYRRENLRPALGPALPRGPGRSSRTPEDHVWRHQQPDPGRRHIDQPRRTGQVPSHVGGRRRLSGQGSPQTGIRARHGAKHCRKGPVFSQRHGRAACLRRLQRRELV